jgi:hypothetical protein
MLWRDLKRGNLGCKDCYVYHMGNDGWKSQPKKMSERVLDPLRLRADASPVRHSPAVGNFYRRKCRAASY